MSRVKGETKAVPGAVFQTAPERGSTFRGLRRAKRVRTRERRHPAGSSIKLQRILIYSTYNAERPLALPARCRRSGSSRAELASDCGTRVRRLPFIHPLIAMDLECPLQRQFFLTS
jgi:hypothetical protein